MNKFPRIAIMMAACLAAPVIAMAGPLHDAVRLKDVAMARQLLDSGADPDAVDDDQSTPLGIAVQDGDAPIVQLLLDRGIDVSTPPPKGKYRLDDLLQTAVMNGSLQVTQLLFAKGSDAARNNRALLDTLLRTAIQYSHDDIAKWLVAQGADVNYHVASNPGTNSDGQEQTSLLLLASHRGRQDVVTLLLAHGAKAWPGEDAATIMLCWAAAAGRVDVMARVLKNGADPSHCREGEPAPEDDGEQQQTCTRPLTLAVESGKLKAVSLLLKNGADPQDALFTAICSRNLPILKALDASVAKRGGASAGEPGSDTNDARMAQAATCGDKAVLAYVMAGVKQVDYDHVTQNLSALLAPPYNTDAQAYDAPGPQPDTRLLATLYAKDPAFPQHASSLLGPALASGYDKVATFLYAKGATMNDVGNGDALRTAVSNGYPSVIVLVIAHGADPNVRTAIGNTPLLLAAPNGNPKVAAALLAHGAEVNAKNDLFNTALHLAAARDLTDFAAVLIKHGARVNAINRDGNTPLHQAARFTDQFKIMRLLLETRANPNIRNRDGMTPLHYVAVRGISDYNEKAYIKSAAASGTRSGANSDDLQQLYGYQFPTEMPTSEAERIAAIKLLLQHGADPSIRNRNGDTALALMHKYFQDPEFLHYLNTLQKK
jgi:ankyrin repeat protein